MEVIKPFLEPGLIYGLGALGLAIIFRYLRFPDFTVLGSIMVGGVVAINITALVGPVSGILVGGIASAALGLLTALLVIWLAIPPILSGIIVFTGSLSIGYLLTEGGTVDLEPAVYAFFEPSYAVSDLVFLIFISLVLCLMIAVLMSTRWGALLLAMTADDRFVRYRHRYQNLVFSITCLLGNGLVGISGAMYALNDRAAHVHSHIDFLPFALGAVFAGNAVTMWLSHLVGKYRVSVTQLKEEKELPADSYLMKKIEAFVTSESNNAANVFFLMLSYVLGAVVFTVISRAVQANELWVIDSDFQYLVVALLMTIFVWWSGIRDKKE